MSMAQYDGWIWIDGKWTAWRDAQVHILTHTLHYGMGVFEGVRAYQGDSGTAIFRLKDHTRRLFDSAHALRMKIPYSFEQVNGIQKEVLRKNGLSSAYIRPIVFYGAESMGLHAKDLQVHFSVIAWDWGSYLGEENIEKGIRVKTSSFARHHVNSMMSKVKANGNYMNSMLALQEALDAGCDEALMLDVDGYVSEGSGENIFIVRDKVLITPQILSVLNGVTRRTIITLAREGGYEVRELQFTRDMIYTADEAFFTGTAAEVMPIRELDKRIIGNGGRGPITRKLQQLYFDVVRGKHGHEEWLAHI